MLRHLPIVNAEKRIKNDITQRVDQIISLYKETNGVLNEKIIQLTREIDNSIFNFYEIIDAEREIIISMLKEQVIYFQNIHDN